MDYPAPLVRVTASKELDFSQAYGVGVGAWDKFATKWLYAQFPDDVSEPEALEAIVDEAKTAGLIFVGDREARSVATGHADGAVWDNGDDPVAMLAETLAVRRIALENFGARALQNGRPYGDLRQVIVPIYLYHRYQTAAAAKLLGGVRFDYGVKGSDAPQMSPVSGERQRAARDVLLTTLSPATLDLSETVLAQLSPPLGRFGRFAGAAERMDGATAPIFDASAAADTAAEIALSAMLHPARASRLVEQHRRDASLPGLAETLDAIENTVFAPSVDARLQSIAEITQARFVFVLMELSLSDDASMAARAIADGKLTELRNRLRPGLLNITGGADRQNWLLARINAHLERPAHAVDQKAEGPDTPPGSPIGDPGILETCWHCDAL